MSSSKKTKKQKKPITHNEEDQNSDQGDREEPQKEIGKDNSADSDGGDHQQSSTGKRSEKASGKKKPKAKKAKTEDESGSGSGSESESESESESFIDLGGSKRIFTSDFREKTYLNIREIYKDKYTGEEKIGKGVSLTSDQFEKIIKEADRIRSFFRK